MAEMRRTMKAAAARTNLFIEPELWRALKVRAIQEGLTATTLLNRIIEDYLRRHPGSLAAFQPKKRKGKV